jgi:signal transduction histidine kinase
LEIGDKRFHEVLNLLELSSKRLNEISNGLLEKRGGEEAAKKKLVSVHHVLDALLGEYLEQHVTYPQMQIEKKYHREALFVLGDPVHLGRAFGNVMKNAVEAMQGDGRLTVTTSVFDPFVQVIIGDTGPGMTQDKIAKILKGGFTEGKANGHGIGLGVVREMVEEHNGELRVESEVGVGTQFIFRIPVATSLDVNESAKTLIANKIPENLHIFDNRLTEVTTVQSSVGANGLPTSTLHHLNTSSHLSTPTLQHLRTGSRAGLACPNGP